MVSGTSPFCHLLISFNHSHKIKVLNELVSCSEENRNEKKQKEPTLDKKKLPALTAHNRKELGLKKLDLSDALWQVC